MMWWEMAGDVRDESAISDMPSYADLEVTYTDGYVEVIKDVHYQATPDELNPIQLVNGVVRIETAGFDGQEWSLIGVRKMRFL